MARFRYDVRDRRYGKIFERDQVIEAASKSEARKALAKIVQRDQPRDARNYGYVPFRDWDIIWLEA